MGRRAKARIAVLGGLFLAGAVAEPISHDLIARRLRGDEAVVATLNVLLPLAIMATTAASLVERATREQSVISSARNTDPV